MTFASARVRQEISNSWRKSATQPVRLPLCGLGKSAPNPVASTIKYFRDEYQAHIVDKKCPAGICKELTAYYVERDLCVGCGLCKRNCPADAITGELKAAHVIDMGKCIKCGNCIDNLQFNAIKVE